MRSCLQFYFSPTRIGVYEKDTKHKKCGQKTEKFEFQKTVETLANDWK
jgi:hypothetical protein